MGVPIIVKELRPRKVDLERVREKGGRNRVAGALPNGTFFCPGSISCNGRKVQFEMAS